MTYIKRISALIALISICFSLTGCAQDYSSERIDDYNAYINEVAYAELHLPSQNELGSYSSVKINRRPVKNIFFETMNSITLIVYYDADAFEKTVDAIGVKYKFLDKAQEGLDEVEATVNGVPFRVVSNGNSFYPSWFMSLGVDVPGKRIIYLYHLDIETHEIDSLETFIKKSYNLDGV